MRAGSCFSIQSVRSLIDGLAEFDFGRKQHALLICQVGFDWRDFTDIDAIERPVMAFCSDPQFIFGFGQRQVKAFLTPLGAFHQKTQSDRRLACTWLPFKQVNATPQQSAAQNHVQLRYAGE